VLVPPDDAKIVLGIDGAGGYRRSVWRVLPLPAVVAGLLATMGSAADLPQQQLAFSRAGNVLTIEADGTGTRLVLRRLRAGLVARRLEARVRLEPFRRRGDLRREGGRHRRHPADSLARA
jgi:hypothetical protein